MVGAHRRHRGGRARTYLGIYRSSVNSPAGWRGNQRHAFGTGQARAPAAVRLLQWVVCRRLEDGSTALNPAQPASAGKPPFVDVQGRLTVALNGDGGALA